MTHMAKGCVFLGGKVMLRTYFEDGCMCLLTGRIVKQDSNDSEAVKYYMERCTCSRHPESATRLCWDREESKKISGRG